MTGTYVGVKVILLPMFRVKLELKKGEIPELLSDCAQSINNIPVDTKSYTLLSVEQDGTKLRYLIQH